jgi:hypothetical protein
VKVKSLAKIVKGHDDGVHLSFFRPTLSLPYAAKNIEHAREVAETFCRDTALREGKPWVAYWSGQGDSVNCPEGYIKLPIDLWCCKISSQICQLQANISLDDKESFLKGCHAPNNKKDAILKTVLSGRYEGFHHVPGRYLCVACEAKGGKKGTFFYHYPWEFAELDLALGETYENTHRNLITRGWPTTFVSCPVCASCCYELATTIQPGLEKTLVLFEFDIDFRAKNA